MGHFESLLKEGLLDDILVYGGDKPWERVEDLDLEASVDEKLDQLISIEEVSVAVNKKSDGKATGVD